MMDGRLLPLLAIILIGIIAFPGCKSAPSLPKPEPIDAPRSLVPRLEATDAQAAVVAGKAPPVVKPDADKLKDMTAANIAEAKAQDTDIVVVVQKATQLAQRAARAEAERDVEKARADDAEAKGWIGKMTAGIGGIFALLGWAGVLSYAYFAMKDGVGRKLILRVFPILGGALVIGMLVSTYFWPLFIGALAVAAVGVLLAVLGVVKVPVLTIQKNGK